MTRREKLLGSIFLVTAAAAIWSARGFPLGGTRASPALFEVESAHPCPPGFAPRSEPRRLPDVPAGEIRPAGTRSPEQCVALARSDSRPE